MDCFCFQRQADPLRAFEGDLGREVGLPHQRVRTKLGDFDSSEKDFGGPETEDVGKRENL